MTTPGETLGNTSGETSGSQQPQVERGAVLGRIADGLANLGVLKQAGVTDPGADPMAPPIASSEQPIGSTDSTTSHEGQESSVDPQQRMIELLEANNAAHAIRNRLALDAAREQSEQAEKDRAQTEKHLRKMRKAAREQVEAATATHGALEGLTAEQQEANRLAVEQQEATAEHQRRMEEAAEATYRLQYEVNAPELQRQAAAQRAAEQAQANEAARLEARPQWVKNLEANLVAEPDTKQHGRLVMDSLLQLAQETASRLRESTDENYGGNSFSYHIEHKEQYRHPKTNLMEERWERGVTAQETKKTWYGRTKTKTVKRDDKKTLVYAFKGVISHPQDSGSEGATYSKAIAIDPETGYLYQCTGTGARLLGREDFASLFPTTGDTKPKTVEGYMNIAQRAVSDLRISNSSPQQNAPRANPGIRGAWDNPNAASQEVFDGDDEPTEVIQVQAPQSVSTPHRRS